MRRNNIFLIFLLWVCWLGGGLPGLAHAQSKQPAIALFTHRWEQDAFWGRYVGFAEKAAKDFNLRLKAHYAQNNLPRMRQQIEQAASSGEFDLLIFPNFKHGGRSFLEIAERHQVPAFMVNQGFTETEKMGQPRQEFSYWIGELLPDESEAGELLAKSLIEEGKQRFGGSVEQPLEVVGITGIVSGYAALERVRGLERMAQRYLEVRIRQIVPANWQESEAAQSFAILHRRYPKVQLVWCASDVMAQGVIAAARAQGLTPGKDVLIGGVDWAEVGLQAVASGTQWASVGGHFLEGGWSVVLAFDYLQGRDFGKLHVSWRTRMEAVSAENWEAVSPALEQLRPEQIDFRKYSRHLNPEKVSYDFRVDAVLEQIQSKS